MNLLELVKVPDEQRDHKWEIDFFMAITQSNLNLIHEAPQKGPDGWPYLLAETSAEATEPANKIMQWLAMKGVGLAVNPRKDYPDYVFTYGMLWHFKETGLFYRTADEAPVGTMELERGQGLHAGPPAPHYLPQYVRNILKQFFLDQNVMRPRILVMSQDRKNYDLAFSLESLGNPPTKEHQGIAEAISWFLPPHYSLLLVSEIGLPEFSDL
ncbi:hypothetical protein AZI86_05685 [Bdellovibrio bacteriovorus]|uniref:Uncharacterized protein n=1 Tax=Bdellovibrio bacteriovorus TaxID=959 RepID=A0A150WQ92_BDEBC|nr:hypothetical protein [Bdellovibrio bacteriovorus]KYG66536.1 hypothetical protein AZI86_05685 [Bdellovibrio bacteriovorus]